MAAKKKPKAEVFEHRRRQRDRPPPEGDRQHLRRQRRQGGRGRDRRGGARDQPSWPQSSRPPRPRPKPLRPPLCRKAPTRPTPSRSCWIFWPAAPEAENDPYADQPTKTAPELPELTPAQQLAGLHPLPARRPLWSRPTPSWSAGGGKRRRAAGPDARRTPSATDIVSRTGAKDTYYYSSANMSDNYAMIAQLIEDRDLCVMFAEMVRFNARIYPSATPLQATSSAPPTALRRTSHRADLEGHAGAGRSMPTSRS